MSLSRDDRSGLSAWWWTIDRVALISITTLIAIGLVLAFAASPAATGGPLATGDFRFAAKQIAFAAIAGIILVGSSQLSLRAVKIAAASLYALAMLGAVLVLFGGSEVLGAKRWLDLGWISLQPSEFLKPGFAVVAAAVLAGKNAKLSRPLTTFLLVAPALILLVLEPDDGQTALLLALWGALLFFYGIELWWVGLFSAASLGLGALAFFLFPHSHLHHRLEQYFDPGKTGYQTGLALKAFAHGGIAGVGPGAGTVKYHIPEAHSDFIFAVAGEEFGLALCAVIAVLFCTLGVRLLSRSARMNDRFCELAGAGLASVVALQAFINMGVAVSLLPAKGMTLPFISYGGSSLFAVALTMGFALAVTRQRPKVGERPHGVFALAGEARPA
ncbi:MAG TPA: FtsW/RodA/SpoVE family cell cycle protein [Rhizomicrobium sp.]